MTVLTLKKSSATETPNKNRLDSQNQTFHTIVDYSDKPFGYHMINYKNLLEMDGESFEPFELETTNGKYQVKTKSNSPWQRDTHARVKSNTSANGHFNDLNVMARYVPATLYVGEKAKVENQHEIDTGTLVFDDAHARMLASKLHIGRNPYNDKCILNVPEQWFLLVTVTHDINDLRLNYDANDFKGASKTKRHEVQSILRALNYLVNIKSDFIKQGLFASSIDVAVPVKKSSPKALQDLEMLDQIKLIKKPLELIDAKITGTTRSAKNPNVALQHQVLGILLMFLQDSAYGNDKMLMQAIERLIINDEDKTIAKKDGINMLCNLFEGNSTGYDALRNKIGGKYESFKPTLNGKNNNKDNLLPLSKGMTYFERTEGPNLVVYLIYHYLSTDGATVDIDAIDWSEDIANKYKNLVSYVYNGGTSI